MQFNGRIHLSYTENTSPERLLVRLRIASAMALALTSGVTNAIGYLALGHIFTSAMTGNLTLLGIAVAHREGLRTGRVLVSLLSYMVGAAVGARIAGSPDADDPLWPPAVTRALVVESVLFVLYTVLWYVLTPHANVYNSAALLSVGAAALGIQSSAMQRFNPNLGMNTTFLSGSLVRLVARLADGRRYDGIRGHLVVLIGLVCGGFLGALLVVHAPRFAPVAQLVPLAFALGAALFQGRCRRATSHMSLVGSVLQSNQQGV